MDLSSRSTTRGTPSRIGLLVLSILLVVWSCDNSDIRPVYPRALCGPDTLEMGAPLVLDFFYDAATGGHIESYSWVAVEDTLLELALLYSHEERGGCSARGCSARRACTGRPSCGSMSCTVPPPSGAGASGQAERCRLIA
jgi:hypothetical protein